MAKVIPQPDWHTTANPDVSNLDIYSKVGANTAYATTINSVQATPGPLGFAATITISTIANVGQPELSAIELTPLPPNVVAITPASNATGVLRATKVTAKFDRGMQAALFTTSSVTLKDPAGTIVPATVTWAPLLKTVTLTPSAALAANTKYTVTLDTTLKSLSGMNLASPYTWSFTTGAS